MNFPFGISFFKLLSTTENFIFCIKNYYSKGYTLEKVNEHSISYPILVNKHAEKNEIIKRNGIIYMWKAMEI